MWETEPKEIIRKDKKEDINVLRSNWGLPYRPNSSSSIYDTDMRISIN